MRRFFVTAAILVAALAAPVAARAATATTADGDLRYTAAAGEANNVSFSRVSGETFRVIDLGAVIVTGTGCAPESPNIVTCTVAPLRPIIANLGDGDDSATSRTSRTVDLFGEDGNDRLTGGSGRDAVDGGPGDDVLSGGAARDSMSGDAGNDQLFGNPGNDNLHGGDGNDVLDGGLGNDVESGGNGDDTLRQSNAPDGADALFGDAGIDTVDYGQRPGSVIVTPDGVANDGDRNSNERDNVRGSVEGIVGGAGSDVLFGREGRADTLIGGPGSDLLIPLRGNDTVDGGPGNDQIRLRDLNADHVVCGDGNDSVAADQRDDAASDCEKVRTTAAMSLGLATSRPAYPTVRLRLACPLSAFKSCRGRVVVRTLGKVRTAKGMRKLTVGVQRFTIGRGSSRLIGLRVRRSVRPFIGRHGRVVRASLSAFDGAGPSRRDPMRFRLRRG